jgi:hypothetical protein
MKGWLRTLGLTALLAGSALANEVEIVSDIALSLGPISHYLNDEILTMFIS